jgi:flavodoxin
MKKNLVVFYSHGGKTKMVANYIANSLKCDIIEIGLPQSRLGFIGFLKLIMDGIKKRCPSIIILETNWNAYEQIIIGSPIWGGTFASPIYELLTQYLKHTPNYAFFSTSGGELPKNAQHKMVTDIASLIGKPALATVNIVNKKLKNSGWENALQSFLNELK